MAAVEQQPAVSGPGRQVPPNKETERGETKLTSNGVDHPFDAAPGVKQAKMSGDTGPAATQPPNAPLPHSRSIPYSNPTSRTAHTSCIT